MGAPIFPVDCMAYCDESKYGGAERFRAICCVSVREAAHDAIDGELRALLDAASKVDIGFEDVRTARDRNIAEQLMRCAVRHAAQGNLQVRTIIWDAYDKRHGPGTDELRNLERMYVHLLRDVLARRWTAKTWEVRPDEQTAIRWNALARILENAASKTATRPVEVRHLAEQSSASQPLIQVADLYAGLMSYYAFKGSAFIRLNRLPPEQRDRVLQERIDPILSSSDRERFKLLADIVALHEVNGITARLTNKGLVFGTSVASVVYNWLYEPQGEEDRAPRRTDDKVAASFFFECSEADCTNIVELAFDVTVPLCGKHYVERNPEAVERKADREIRREAERIYREGSHYCGECGFRGTPGDVNLRKADFIGKHPQCPICKRWSLTSLLSQGSEDVSLHERVSDFEQRQSDRWSDR